MRKVMVELIDAFTSRRFAGNPAGVVHDDVGLKEDEMLSIAGELRASTTGFVSDIDDNAFRIRFFTEKCEVDMCGHVTLGCALSLAMKQSWSAGRRCVRCDTRAGTFSVEIVLSSDGAPEALIDMGTPEVVPLVIERALVSAALAVNQSALSSRLPVARAHGGLRHLLVPIGNANDLFLMSPKRALVEELSAQFSVDTIAPFTFEECDPPRIRCRDFCPAIGHLEESASGTTNAAIAMYVASNGLSFLPQTGDAWLCSTQGTKRASELRLRVRVLDGNVKSVSVGGTGVRTLTGVIELD